MQVKCVICGKEEQINKLHKDYRKVEANPNAVYVCEMCNFKLSAQAAKDNSVLDKK